MTDIGFTGYAMKINDRGSNPCGVKRGSDFSQLLIKEGKKIPLDMDWLTPSTTKMKSLAVQETRRSVRSSSKPASGATAEGRS